jgi:DNA-directed RNA polymerase specialized sigma24 family protein
MASVLSSENLRKRYLAALQIGAPWFDVWRLLLEDEWFRAELKRHAEYVIKAHGEPLEWVEDVQHEAMLLLAAKLRARTDLGLDASGLADHLGNNISLIARDDCQDARRRLHRLFGTNVEPLPGDDQASAIGVSPIQEMALRTAIDDLPAPLATLFRLRLMGYNIGEIASHLHLTYKQAYRGFRRGLQLLHKDLA